MKNPIVTILSIYLLFVLGKIIFLNQSIEEAVKPFNFTSYPPYNKDGDEQMYDDEDVTTDEDEGEDEGEEYYYEGFTDEENQGEYDWVVGKWSRCNSKCGMGRQFRRVTCRDQHGNRVSSLNCSGRKPRNVRMCHQKACSRDEQNRRARAESASRDDVRSGASGGGGSASVKLPPPSGGGDGGGGGIESGGR